MGKKRGHNPSGPGGSCKAGDESEPATKKAKKLSKLSNEDLAQRARELQQAVYDVSNWKEGIWRDLDTTKRKHAINRMHKVEMAYDEVRRELQQRGFQV
mmetsp:Transcript_4846/g.14941  ORF Transcript_4846/g.14941 Transcript_4846/m.14941 type:complete len:99 (+) Transcript_4846:131-427(+)